MKEKKNNLIKKAHNLVEARYHFNIWEARIFARMVSMIHKDDIEFKRYKIEVKDIIEFYDLNTKDAYKHIKAAPISLLKKTITIPYISDDGEKRILRANLLSSISEPVNMRQESYIEVSFDPVLMPYLLQLKERFLMYDIRNILRLTSPYAVRIYELLKQYEKIGVRQFSIKELKECLGVKDKYKAYSDFRKRIILYAQEHLAKNTDIAFTFEQIKRGRRITAIKFFITKNTPSRQPQKQETISVHPSNPSLQKVGKELYLQVSKYMSIDALEKLLEKYPEPQIRTAIQLTLNRIENGDTIKNPAGHIIKMAAQPSLFDHIEQEKHQKKQKAEKAKQKKAFKLQKEQLEQQLKELEASKMDAMKETSKKLLKNNSLRIEIIEELKQATYLRKWIEDVKKLEDAHPIAQAAIVKKMAEKKPKKFVVINKRYDEKIGELRKKINEI